MRVVILNTNDRVGGAARAAYRLHRSLIEIGIESFMLVEKKSSTDPTVIGPKGFIDKSLAIIRPILDSLFLYSYKDREKRLFSPNWASSKRVIKRIKSLNPDILHIHWTAGMLKIEDLKKLNIPIYWSLHDDWAFTGGCHIKWDCTRYLDSCGKCPSLKSRKTNDLSRKQWKRKKKTYSKIDDLRIIGLSNWMSDCAQKSNLLGDKPIYTITNPIDIRVFKPYSKRSSRELLNLPKDKKLIGFGAVNAVSDINKGFDKLHEALSQLNEDYELVVFGSNEGESSHDFKQKVWYLGQLSDDLSLRLLYSALDVFIVPSRQETSPLTAVESMACGTPVVAFGTTGILDVVLHKKTGYLAEPYNSEDLSKGIKWVLECEHPEKITLDSRQHIVENFDSKIVANRYLSAYTDR